MIVELRQSGSERLLDRIDLEDTPHPGAGLSLALPAISCCNGAIVTPSVPAATSSPLWCCWSSNNGSRLMRTATAMVG